MHRFLCYPWAVASLFDHGTSDQDKKAEAERFWNTPQECIDPWMGVPLRTNLCDSWEDLLNVDLQEFVWTMFRRGLVSSVFVERVFAPMTQWTSNPKARLSLAMVAALHVNTVRGCGELEACVGTS